MSPRQNYENSVLALESARAMVREARKKVREALELYYESIGPNDGDDRARATFGLGPLDQDGYIMPPEGAFNSNCF